MTRATNAKVAGITFLVYIAAAMPAMILFGQATGGEGVDTQLAGIARHATGVRLAIVFAMIGSFCALVLAVTLYAITRDQDRDVAMLALTCRVGEGIIGLDVSRTIGLVWLATAADAAALDHGATASLAAYFLRIESSFTASAALFAVGSTLFCWLLVRGRMIPVALAWFGVLSSVIVAVCFPLQLAGFLDGPFTTFMWYPVLLFEIVFAVWLIVKGVAVVSPRPRLA